MKRIIMIWILAVLMLTCLLSFSSISLAGGDTWAKRADMPTTRRSLATSVVNGKIYAIGGTTGASLSTVEEYDPATDTWAKKANMPTARGTLSTSVLNGKIYAIGGWVGRPTSVVEEYNPATDTWTKKADMLTARSELSTSAVNGKIYAIGGWNGVWFASTVEEYDPATNRWTKKADMPTARYELATSVVNGKIYAIGGGGPDLSTVEEYDPATDKWTKKADMPTPRAHLSASAVNGKIYAIGGAILQGLALIPLSTVEEYNPATDTWTRKADMPTARGFLSASAVNGKIYAIGGWKPDVHLSTVEEYDTGFADQGIEPEGKLVTTWGKLKAGD